MAVFVTPIRASIHTDYLLGGALTLKNGRIDKYQFDEGYCQAEKYPYNTRQDDFTFCYYDKDHLGNIRQVKEADGTKEGWLLQTMDYYPFGAQFCDGTTDSNVQSHKYNGKEFDQMHGLNTYDYGARQYNPVTGRWDRVDQLAEDNTNVSPYMYCAGNPVNLIDPDGRFYTDFVDINTGGISKIEDGVDNVIAASTSEIKKMEELFNNSIGDYQEELSAMEATSANLNMTSSEFEEFAGAIYAESSGGFGKSLGIVDVLKNRAKNQGNSIKEQLSSKPPYGVYGVNNKGKQYHNEKGKSSDIKRSNIHRAIAVGLSTDTETSNGAYFWDGTDIKTNSHYTQWGVTFTNPLHNLWNQKNTNGRHQLITTTAIGKTIFTKFKNQGKKWYISN